MGLIGCQRGFLWDLMESQSHLLLPRAMLAWDGIAFTCPSFWVLLDLVLSLRPFKQLRSVLKLQSAEGPLGPNARPDASASLSFSHQVARCISLQIQGAQQDLWSVLLWAHIFAVTRTDRGFLSEIAEMGGL